MEPLLFTSFHQPSNCLPNNTAHTSQSDARLACRRRPDIGSTNQDRPLSGRGGAGRRRRTLNFLSRFLSDQTLSSAPSNCAARS